MAITAAPATTAARAFKCVGCEALLCNTCTLSAPRKANAAQCMRCAGTSRFSFDVQRWLCVLNIFISNADGALRVDKHVLGIPFISTTSAFKQASLYVRAYYPDAPLFAQLADAIPFLDASDAQRREFRLSTEFVMSLAQTARVEVHLRVAGNEQHTHVLPQQMQTLFTANEISE